jgi:GT2 family glycosyltransferase
VRECDAVTGACMMISKDLFLELNGFDEEYWVECQDVDLCLKARNKGLKVIYAPKSVLIHHEMITRGPVKAEEEIHDTAVLKRKWFEKQGDNAIK